MKKEERNNHNHIPSLKEKALGRSIKEGTAANIATNLGDNNIIPFAVALNSTPIQIGLLSSFSGFLYQLSQYFGARMMEGVPRKKIVLRFVLLQALMWLFIALVGFLVWKGLFDGFSAWVLIVFYSILMFFGGIAYPAWFSWMGDIVPQKTKGQYFGKRNLITGIAGLIALLLGAFLLDYWKTKGLVLLAFSVLFALAFLFRFISYVIFKTQYSPQFKAKKRDYFSFFSFVKRYDNFGKFAVYQGLLNLAIMIASPFFTVYMLKELGFSYTLLTLSTISYVIFYLLFLPVAGRFSDSYGNKKLVTIANIFFIITPILYILFKAPLWIILLPQLSAGIANAASTISFSNFTYDSVSQKHRGICVTYTNIMIGIGTLVGSILGGFIVSYAHPASFNPYIFVFVIAAILRAGVASIILPKIKEVRKVNRLPAHYNLIWHPINTFHAESIRLLHYPEKILGKFKSLRLF